MRGLGCSEAFEEIASGSCHINGVCDSHNVIVDVWLEVVEIGCETISQHSVLKADHSIGAWLSLVDITIIAVIIIATSIVFIINSINIWQTLQRFPP